ncbi:10036_t:CDS:2, partial [Rhizophagus irregularis]
LKSFKIIQTARGERKWVDMRAVLDNQVIWENNNLSWNQHAPPTQPTRSRGGDANKNHNQTSRSQKTEKTQSNSKNSKKKPEVATSKKPEEQKKKKDKSRNKSKNKVLAEILDLLRGSYSSLLGGFSALRVGV